MAFEEFGAAQGFMARAAELTDQMGPAPKVVVPGLHTFCSVRGCRNRISEFNLPVIRTVLCPGAVERVCASCLAAMPKDYARVICLGCREVVLRLQPGLDPSGFEFRRGAFYHTENCPNCVPGLSHSTLVEKALYDRVRGQRRIFVSQTSN